MSISESKKAWQKTAEKSMTKSPERKSSFRNSSDIEIERCYTPEFDYPEYEEELGLPGGLLHELREGLDGPGLLPPLEEGLLPLVHPPVQAVEGPGAVHVPQYDHRPGGVEGDGAPEGGQPALRSEGGKGPGLQVDGGGRQTPGLEDGGKHIGGDFTVGKMTHAAPVEDGA